jgi:hypothetical protein
MQVSCHEEGLQGVRMPAMWFMALPICQHGLVGYGRSPLF